MPDKKLDERTRNWTFVVYPESAPENWKDILDAEHIQWIESPLHDRDLNPDGEAKKAHWHVVVLFAGKKSFSQVKELTDSLHSPIPQKVANAKGVIRYMAHMDNPEKFQYKPSEIIGHGGVDVAEYLKPSSSSRYHLIGEMIDFVRENNIVEMKDLLYYARSERFDDWFPLLCDNSAYIMNSLIKSNRHAMQIDPETGEVLNKLK